MCTCAAFCCYGRHHDQIKLRERKSLFCLTPDNPPLSGKPRQGTQGKNLGAAAEAEPVGNTAYWLDLHSLLGMLSLATQDSMPRGGSAHSGLGPLISIINQENDTQTYLQGPLMEVILQFLFPDESGLFQVEPNYLAQ